MKYLGWIPRGLLAGLVALWAGLSLAAGATSSWVLPAPNGRLLSVRDALGNRVPDFSTTGFREGAAALPIAPVRATVNPVAGDDAAAIQAALDAVSTLPPDPEGFRGAVLLAPGEYQIAGHLRIQASGVVLRGSGSGPGGTILRATGPGQRTLLRVSTDAPRSNVVNTTRTILDSYVPVGARSFTLSSTNGYAPGDRVLVKRPSTQAWIEALGMDQLVNPWTPGSRDIQSDRRILALDGNRVQLDAPLVCALDAAYGGGTVQKYTWPERLRLVGIEDLRGISDFTSATNEDHAWIFIELKCVEDSWVRRVVSQHFGFACVSLDTSAKHVTVEDCEALDPISQVIGNRRYAFVLDDAELCLVRHCRTRQDRHHFVTQSNTDGPNAFVDGWCEEARNDVGPHQRWATGALWDSIEVYGHLLNIQNRGNLGTGHGWAGANCIAWNCLASGGFIVQSPPTARNWLVGSVGPLLTGTNAVGPVLPGAIDSHGTPVFPRSLHAAQLQQRLATPGLQFREHVAGDFDLFQPTNGPAGGTPVDPAWLDQVVEAAGGTNQVIGLDDLTPRRWVAWSHSVPRRPGEQVLSATLSLSLRATGSGWTSDRLYFDRLNDSPRLTNYATTLTTNGSTVLTIDLADRLAALADGRLDLALQDEVAVDWSVLEWTLAPAATFSTNVLNPEADAVVRGGIYATTNYGIGTKLATKEDPSDDVRRRSLLRWDLSSLTGRVVHAAIRLLPVTVNLDGVENTAAVAGNAWTEAGVTWSNQPPAGRRFASWQSRLNTAVTINVTPQVQEALQGDRKLTLQLASARDVGSAGYVEYAARESTTASTRPQLILLLTNTPPVLSPLPGRLLLTNRSTGPIPFTVSDGESSASALAVSATSSHPSLIAPAGLVLGGSGSNRTLTVTHSGTSTGLTTITLAATDGFLTNRLSWRLTVAASNTPPTLDAPASVAVPEDTPVGPLVFTVGDAELPPEDLEVTVRSSNTNLIPQASLHLGGTGSLRTLTAFPRADAGGEASLSLRVADGLLAVTGVVTVVVQPVNDPPSRVALTSPLPGQRAAAGDAVILLAEAADPDDTDLQVRFLANGLSVATALDGPYRQVWVPPTPGEWTLQAVATDPAGLSLTSAPLRLAVEVVPVRLVPSGAAWRYRDTAVAPPANWMQPGFDDGAWPLGNAPLGYGTGNVATVLGTATSRPFLAWFRHRFTLPPEPLLASLVLRVQRDDGVRIWLNGVEVLRDNLPPDPLNPQAAALLPIDDAAESAPVTAALTLAGLVPGTNLLAAEVRQASPSGDDLRLDVELLGYPQEALPQLQAESLGADLRLRWPAWAAGFTLQSSPSLGPQAVWTSVPEAVSIRDGQATVVLPFVPSARFFRLLQL